MPDYDFRISRANRVKDAHERIVAALDAEGRVFSTQDLVKL
jgi:hypothetical protein